MITVPTSSRSRTTVDPGEILEWDARNWSAALDFWQRHSAQDLRARLALEIGSRHGGLSLWLASQGARVVCSDVGEPSARAMQKHRAAGVSHLIEYESLDGTRIPYIGRFDVVAFKSVLGAVGRDHGREGQRRAVAEMHKALKPGGELLFAENLVASPVHRFCRRRFVRWGATWRYLTIADMRECLAPFAVMRYRAVGFAAAFGRSKAQRDVLGRLDRVVLDLLVPERWRYVIVGLARK